MPESHLRRRRLAHGCDDEDSGSGELEAASDAQGGADVGSTERWVFSDLPGQAWRQVTAAAQGEGHEPSNGRRNGVTLLIRNGIGSMDAANGEITSLVISMFRPEKGQTLR